MKNEQIDSYQNIQIKPEKEVINRLSEQNK